MAHPMPPVSPCALWPCSGTSTPTGLVRAATTRLVALRSTTSMASSITPTGSTTCSSPPPWEGENYEPRNPMESETFNHGKGYVIGHQWTNIVLLLGDILIPLRPIPFYSKRYCQTHSLVYQSEHEHVVTYLRTLDLEDYIGSYDRREVLVLADSGYDNKKIEKAIGDKGWHCIIALGKTRSVKSQALSLTTPHSQQWCHIDTFFRRQVVSLQPAAKYQRPAWGPSPGQNGAAHRALMASQLPSAP